MNLPFTTGQFLSVFARYNDSIWPGQIFLNTLAVLSIILCFRANVPSALISALLAGLWMWTGAVYHMVFFSSINPAAFAFGGLCVLQGALILWFGVMKPELTFGYRANIKGYAGALLIAYALVAYPVLGYFQGHVYPYSPTFGAPCPTTIFTFGLLLWTTTRVRWPLMIIPCLWGLVGSTAALNLGIREDIGLLVSGVLGTAILAAQNDSRVKSADDEEAGAADR